MTADADHTRRHSKIMQNIRNKHAHPKQWKLWKTFENSKNKRNTAIVMNYHYQCQSVLGSTTDWSVFGCGKNFMATIAFASWDNQRSRRTGGGLIDCQVPLCSRLLVLLWFRALRRLRPQRRLLKKLTTLQPFAFFHHISRSYRAHSKLPIPIRNQHINLWT